MPPAPTQSRCAGPLGHYICASITTEAAPTVKLHSSPLFSGTCRRTASDKGTGLEQIQRELNTLQPKLGNSRPREFPHALINAHYTGAFSFSVIAQQPRAHGGSYYLPNLSAFLHCILFSRQRQHEIALSLPRLCRISNPRSLSEQRY